MAATNTLCRYFANNCCTFGDQCRLSHDRSVPLDNTCRYYLQGACTYGTRCRFDHVRPRSQPSTTPDTPSSTKPTTAGHTKPSPQQVCPQPQITSKLRPDAQEFVPRMLSSDASYTSLESDGGNWNAAQFVPSTYATAVCPVPNLESEEEFPPPTSPLAKKHSLLCPYHVMGHCWYGDNCTFIHGELCDMCYRPVLHPTDTEHNAKHHKECLAEHEKDMEASFAVAVSTDKQCGICMELVVEKSIPSARRFGILHNCKHVFCLECIRKWRKSQQFENQIIRACPECRTMSDFVVPSSTWVEDQGEKDNLIDNYKKNLKSKRCKYFAVGAADKEKECPFGNKCFYRHEAPDGTVIQGDSPRTVRRRMVDKQRQRRRTHPEDFMMWDFLHERRLFADSFNSSWDDSDDDLARRMIELDLDWSDTEDGSDSEDDLVLLRSLQEELQMLTIRSVRHSRDNGGASGGR